MVQRSVGRGEPVVPIGEDTSAVGVRGRARLSVEDCSYSAEGGRLLRFEHRGRDIGLGVSHGYGVIREDALVDEHVFMGFLDQDVFDRAGRRFLLAEFRRFLQYLESLMHQHISVVLFRRE